MQLTLDDTVRALRARWWVLLVAAALAALAAYAYTKLPWVEPRWRSTVSIQATGRFDYGNSLALERQLKPLAEGLRQLNVMRDVDRNLRLDLPPERMLASVTAQPVQDSNQIRVDVDDVDPARAKRMAMEIANVYSEQHNAEQQSKLREEQVILSVLDRQNDAVLTWPQTRILVPVAALLGLIAAAGVVLLLAALDDTLHTAEDVSRVLDLPIMGVLPATLRTRSPRTVAPDGAPSPAHPPVPTAS